MTATIIDGTPSFSSARRTCRRPGGGDAPGAAATTSIAAPTASIAAASRTTSPLGLVSGSPRGDRAELRIIASPNYQDDWLLRPIVPTAGERMVRCISVGAGPLLLLGAYAALLWAI